MATSLELFMRFCEARSFLYKSIKMNDEDESDILDISPHSIVDIFEFFFMMTATNIVTGDKITVLARAHNAECERLLTLDPKALTRLGLNKSKIRDAMFSDKNLKKIYSNFEYSGAIDQSDIARLLFRHMSRETARKALILFDRAGLLKRIDAGDSVLIKSNGRAEGVFEGYLRALAQA